MRTIKARKLPKFTPAPEAVVNRFHALLERLPARCSGIRARL